MAISVCSLIYGEVGITASRKILNIFAS